MWILPLRNVWSRDRAEALRYVMLVLLANVLQMCRRLYFHDGWQHCVPIMIALSLADEGLMVSDVNVLPSDSQTLLQVSPHRRLAMLQCMPTAAHSSVLTSGLVNTTGRGCGCLARTTSSNQPVTSSTPRAHLALCVALGTGR